LDVVTERRQATSPDHRAIGSNCRLVKIQSPSCQDNREYDQLATFSVVISDTTGLVVTVIAAASTDRAVAIAVMDLPEFPAFPGFPLAGIRWNMNGACST